ncbi:S24 family peptidase [Martelella sp. HB161492]|uniref:S24 family peptidase n=1 Tax=Martelella sp. HB161492 TaxID=2720726 RepID=UPI0015923F4E|nr:S24 family peptidase [Martelella sp. HB161492]
MTYNLDMDLKDIVTTRLAELGLGPVEAANRSGLKTNFIADIISGRKSSIQSRNLAKLAEALHLDPSALADSRIVRTDTAPPAQAPAAALPSTEARTVHIAGTVAASYTQGTSFEPGKRLGYLPSPPAMAHISGIYALYVDGRSMEPQFFPGDLIFVHSMRQPRFGDCAVVVTDHGQGPQRTLGIFKSEAAETITLFKRVSDSDPGKGADITIPKQFVTAKHKVLTVNEMFGG